jgi:branched-chain amino acid transport system permease protein
MLILAIVPVFGTRYHNFILCRAIIFAIAALGYNILFGHTGLISFGHAAFYGIGAYVSAFLIRSYNAPMELILLASILVTTATAFAIGLLCIKYRDIYFGILTLAFGQMVYALVWKFYWITRGSEGLSVSRTAIFGIDLKSYTNYYYFVFIIFLVIFGVLWLLHNSPFGKVLHCIKENPTRAEMVGVPVKRYKLYSFVLSSVIPGVAGALFGPFYGHVSPELIQWTASGELIFAILLGGPSTFIGPVVGAILFTILREYLMAWTTYWLLPLGFALIFIVMSFSEGICGTVKKIFEVRSARDKKWPM